MILDILFKGIKTVASLVGSETAKKLTSAAGDIAKAIQTNPEIEQAMMNQEVEIKKIILEDAKDARMLIREQARSEDPFVRRSRPAFLWLFYCIIIFNFVMLPLLNVILSALGKLPFTFIYPTLPEELYWLFGSSFLGYSGFRTFDKVKGKKK